MTQQSLDRAVLCVVSAIVRQSELSTSWDTSSKFSSQGLSSFKRHETKRKQDD